MTGECISRIAIDLQLTIEADGWPEARHLDNLCRATVSACCAYLTRETGQVFRADGCELSLLFTDDAMMREINSQWRNQDKTTNVLSFAASPVRQGEQPGPVLGDIVFALETVRREAAELGIPFDNHLSHLVVHGFLHLLGYDHMNDADAAVMEGHETRILAMLDLSDPYENTIPV
ncbi:MAG: rRNA maturation RNase YbeY [Pseudomonadota bacterium]